MKLRFLVVDDSTTARKVTCKYLNQIGLEAEVYEAGNGEDALKELDEAEENFFNMMLVDWNMPKMDGLELVSKVRENNAHDKLPIIMITSESELVRYQMASAAGVDGYITKPFTADILKNKIRMVLQQRIQAKKAEDG